GADAKNGKIATTGWLEDSDINIIPFIADYADKGITKVISTDIDCDGMLNGPSVKLYKEILEHLPNIYIIASGGVSSMNDIEILDSIKVPAVIVGKAIYEGRISLKELETININKPC
ncbi:MAG: HisA/HisF-related TIM barrel protein, partial [Muribaculaceae bacterium]